MNFLETYAEGIVVGDICNGDTLFIFQIARSVIRIIQIAVPFVLIILGSIDFFKSVVAGDEKEMKQKRKPFVQRVIAAVIIFLLPFLISLIITTFFSNSEFATCWKEAEPGHKAIHIPTAEEILKEKNSNGTNNNGSGANNNTKTQNNP